MKKSEIDEDAIVSLTKKFIQINTSNPPGNEEKLSDLIANLLKQLGFKVEKVEIASGRPNIIATLGSEKQGKTLILNGHLDTVPAGEGWKYSPFEGKVENGRIYGRGATDMKGCIASMIEAVASLKRDGWKPNGCLKLLFTVNEEMGDSEEIGARGIIKKLKKNQENLIVIGDVTNFDIVVSEKGILWLELISYGKETHASMPWTGINSLEKLNKVLYHIQNLKIEGEDKLLGNTTIAITTFNSGIKTNIIPGIAKAQLDIRLIPDEKKEAIIDMIREIIDRLSEEDKDMKIEIKELYYYPPVKKSYNEKIIKIFKESIKSTIKRDPKIAGEHGATGAGYFISAGFPVIVFGPGKPENCHIKDEYIEIKDLINAAKVYKEIIKNYLK